ncbi:hypothetical protein IQ266_24230 [filamentous cyanobacterium LEGE 11480]|uniref:Uncharacterized protein n=1 Tax=Romeriopsis navalis LEGE 11480 TaxID=2777977 RepID=A0A928VQE3_9CYAN|nr:hypothetical protein [Romeriopsis navalis]MBE9032848.1 hypothetical protein [Romeriopsis navalis LEGE 11480]
MSPFTQYFVRKLLRRYLAQPQSLMPYLKVADPGQSDLAQVLRGLCHSEQSFQVLLYELESLIESHSRLEANQARYSPATVNDELVQIEQKVEQLLGLRLGRLLPERLPRLLPEAEGQAFQFCLGSQVQSGICYREHFYGLLQRWPLASQLHAYQTAWTLAQRGVACMVTRSPQEYTVWINLKSPSSTVLLQQGQRILPALLKLSPIMSRRQVALMS